MSNPDVHAPAHEGSWRSPLAVAAMLLGVLAIYVPPALISGDAGLVGLDYYQEHLHRIRYAHEALGTAWPPGWYTRELLGAPFWSNLQSCPLIPTRLALLLCHPLFAYAPGVALAATLSALFTFLYARSVGVGRVGAAVAGWTFACSGYFACRVMAGHLPVLEAYPALPLFLWLNEGRASPARLLALGFATGAAFLAGHPQLPIYALITAVAYAVYRHGRSCVPRVGTMIAGVGTGSVVLWPMVLLIGRSTRMMMIERPANNTAFPLSRLAAFLFPWADGWPATVPRVPEIPFHGYPSDATFWDTVCYVGWLPLFAAGALVAACAWRRRLPARPWGFVALAGLVALLTAVPAVQHVLVTLHLTVLRSPARQLYVTAFALALATGLAADRIGRASPLVLSLLIAVHVLDLGSHDLWFVTTRPLPRDFYQRVSPDLVKQVGDGRLAVDYNLLVPESRTLDDAGFFDSLPLLVPYRGVTVLAGSPPERAEETFNAGAELPPAALAKLCVKLVFTARRRDDLKVVMDAGRWAVYEVPHPEPRARVATGTARYQRPEPDRILVEVDARTPGRLEVVEAWDPGWHATVDGQPAPLVPAGGFLLGVDLTAGRHFVELRFRTPGFGQGLAMSLVCLAVLAGLAARARGD